MIMIECDIINNNIYFIASALMILVFRSNLSFFVLNINSILWNFVWNSQSVVNMKRKKKEKINRKWLEATTSQQNPSSYDNIDINLIEKSARIRKIAICDLRLIKDPGYVYGLWCVDYFIALSLLNKTTFYPKEIYWHSWQF